MTHDPLSTSTFIIQEAAIPPSVIRGKKKSPKMGNKKEAFHKGWAVIRKTGNRRTDPRRLSWWFLGFMPMVPKNQSHGFGFLLVMSKAEFSLDGAHCIVGCFLWVHLL